MNVYLPNLRLPSAYQEVEYIQSSGTQYINLGWNPTDNYFKVVSKVTVYNSNNEWNVLFGTTNGSNSLSLHFRTANPYWNEGWYANIGSSGNIYSSISFVDGENVNINFTGNAGSYSLSLNNDTSIGSYNSTVAQSTRPFYLFAFNENGDATRKTHMKLYSFKLYSGVSTLVRDLVPCYRKSDNEIGLYDLVNNQFYTNAGTGTFSKGNDVTMAVLKNAYIGEYKGWKPGSNTIAYYPLTSTTTVNDKSGNNRNLTNYNGVAFGTYAGVDCAAFSGNKMILYNSDFPARGYGNCTVSCWMYTTSNNQQIVLSYGNADSTGLVIIIRNGYIDPNLAPVTLNVWHHIYYVIDSNHLIMYVDGVQVYNVTYNVNIGKSLGIGRKTYMDDMNYLGYISEVIIESVARTAEQVAGYYNQTKANYGL